MSTFGALLGASVAGLAFKLSGSNFILTFALASIPALASLLLVTAVRNSSILHCFSSVVGRVRPQATPTAIHRPTLALP